jgi:mRNA interferase MazF
VGRPVKGDIVRILFPFSDVSGAKNRPAFVIASLIGDDIILCQITSKSYGDPYSILLESRDFIEGSLPRTSFIRPNKLFTADSSIIDRTLGHISMEKIDEVVASINYIISNP